MLIKYSLILIYFVLNFLPIFAVFRYNVAMRIVTAGRLFLDIDAYACIYAYNELLNKINIQSRAISRAPFNISISKSVLEWQALIERRYVPESTDIYSMVDVSDPETFEEFVNIEKVYEVIDHRPEFVAYWGKKLGQRAQIEEIGACATQIYRKWADFHLLSDMSQASAQLLATAILDNTLNFQAGVTENQDRVAYNDLVKIGKLSKEWPETYFKECQQASTKNFETAVINDSKRLRINGYDVFIGQLVVWDASDLLLMQDQISEILGAKNNNIWFMNIVDIRLGHSIIVCQDSALQDQLSGLLGVVFRGNFATANRCWLRKEIVSLSRSMAVGC